MKYFLFYVLAKFFSFWADPDPTVQFQADRPICRSVDRRSVNRHEADQNPTVQFQADRSTGGRSETRTDRSERGWQDSMSVLILLLLLNYVTKAGQETTLRPSLCPATSSLLSYSPPLHYDVPLRRDAATHAVLAPDGVPLHLSAVAHLPTPTAPLRHPVYIILR